MLIDVKELEENGFLLLNGESHEHLGRGDLIDVVRYYGEPKGPVEVQLGQIVGSVNHSSWGEGCSETTLYMQDDRYYSETPQGEWSVWFKLVAKATDAKTAIDEAVETLWNRTVHTREGFEEVLALLAARVAANAVTESVDWDSSSMYC